MTPLATYCTDSHATPITSKDITATVRRAVLLLGPDLGFLPSDIEAWSLRAGGAMALLNGQVDSNIIQLMGCWRSDAMLRYLHCQGIPTMQGYASRMIQGGDYVLLPNTTVPQQQY
jgi:hypothetical protein